jgi:hypothetical protein
MTVTKAPYGKPVKLLVDYQGYPDGRLVQFEIWRKKGGEEKQVSSVYGVTKGGNGIGWWIPCIERKEILPLEKTVDYQPQEEKYYFIAKIDDEEVKSGEMVFTYPLDVYIEDEDGVAIDELECTVTFSDGSKENAMFKNGHIKIKNAPAGKFQIELEYYEFVFLEEITVSNARWDKEEARRGDVLLLSADVKGARDGTEATIEILEHDADGNHDSIETFPVTVKNEKVEMEWEFEYHEDTDEVPTAEEGEKGYNPPEYFFKVTVKGKTAESSLLGFKDFIEIELVDENGDPIQGRKYILHLPDGKTAEGKLDERGFARVEGVPPGAYKVEFPSS